MFSGSRSIPVTLPASLVDYQDVIYVEMLGPKTHHFYIVNTHHYMVIIKKAFGKRHPWPVKQVQCPKMDTD